MAIDFSEIDILRDVRNDIKKVTSQPEFYEKVVKQAAILHADSAEELTSQQKDPSGAPFPELAPSYALRKQQEVGSRRADLRYSGYAMDNMRIRQKGQNRGAEIYFDGKPAYGNETAGEYMYSHQVGYTKAKRKVFPEASDAQSAPQMEIHRDVHDILGKYLNQPRKVEIVG